MAWHHTNNETSFQFAIKTKRGQSITNIIWKIKMIYIVIPLYKSIPNSIWNIFGVLIQTGKGTDKVNQQELKFLCYKARLNHFGLLV